MIVRIIVQIQFQRLLEILILRETCLSSDTSPMFCPFVIIQGNSVLVITVGPNTRYLIVFIRLLKLCQIERNTLAV